MSCDTFVWLNKQENIALGRHEINWKFVKIDESFMRDSFVKNKVWLIYNLHFHSWDIKLSLYVICGTCHRFYFHYIAILRIRSAMVLPNLFRAFSLLKTQKKKRHVMIYEFCVCTNWKIGICMFVMLNSM